MSDEVKKSEAAAAIKVEEVPTVGKGKGKAVKPIETEDETSDDEMYDVNVEEEEDEEAEDDLAEIDTNNIIGGGRTRGKKIDFAKAAQAEGAVEDEDEDDEEYQAPETEMET
ncbi:Histone H2A.Z-specific chaperone CHZ1 [Rhizina undulata]